MRVLLLEAGGKDRSPNIKIPAAFGKQFHTKLDWGYSTVPQAGCANRELYSPRGRSLGGSSSMNAMLYVRGRPIDYDLWESEGADRLGLAGRGALLPPRRGPRAPARTRSTAPGARCARAKVRSPHDLTNQFYAAAEAAGIPVQPRLQRPGAGRCEPGAGDPARRQALERRRRVPQAEHQAPQPDRAHQRDRARARAGGRPRDRREALRPPRARPRPCAPTATWSCAPARTGRRS